MFHIEEIHQGCCVVLWRIGRNQIQIMMTLGTVRSKLSDTSVGGIGGGSFQFDICITTTTMMI